MDISFKWSYFNYSFFSDPYYWAKLDVACRNSFNIDWHFRSAFNTAASLHVISYTPCGQRKEYRRMFSYQLRNNYERRSFVGFTTKVAILLLISD